MRKVIIFILFFLSIIAIIFRFATQPIIKFLKLEPKAGILVESNLKSIVYINGKHVGETTFQDENLVDGDYLVRVEAKEASGSSNPAWQGYVRLNGGTLTVVNRELTDDQTSSSGETINLDEGVGVTIVSTPQSAEVSIDGNIIGRTPISVKDISPGEHQFLLSKDNFLKRSIRAAVVEGFNLTLSVDLAIAEADLTNIPTIPITTSTQVLIKNTPTGFLRVRKTASINSEEIGRVKPGENLTLIEEIPNWIKIRLPDGKEGYISSQYAEKKTQ